MVFILIIYMYFFFFRVFEEESEKYKEYELFKVVYFLKEFGRLQSLEKDMEFYFGEEWRERVSMFDVIKVYVDRIYEVVDKDFVLLIVYYYIRYLGDLFGG